MSVFDVLTEEREAVLRREPRGGDPSSGRRGVVRSTAAWTFSVGLILAPASWTAPPGGSAIGDGRHSVDFVCAEPHRVAASVDLLVAVHQAGIHRPVQSSCQGSENTDGPELQALGERGVAVDPGDATRVVRYLRDYPEMTTAICRAAETVTAAVGGAAKLALQVYQDPEIDDQVLTLRVRVPQYDQRVLDALDEAMVACEPVEAKSGGWLVVTTDFVPSG